MDLPTCPACKQSVLDDDAVECPFCGAPMKGGPAPSRAPAATKTPSAKTVSAKPGPAKAGPAEPPAKTSPAGRKIDKADKASAASPADDDPFAVDQSATASATPVSPKPNPGKTLEVTCPMCETKGFVSPRSAGKLVKCCNPQCMVPVFTAPQIEKPVVVAPPAPSRKKLPWMYIIGGIGAVAIAVTCIVVMNQPGVTEIPPPELPYPGVVTKKDQAAGAADIAQAKNGEKPGNDAEKAVNAEAHAEGDGEIVTNALQRVVDVQFSIPNHRKSLWLRLLATAYIYAGDHLKQAHERLDLLEKPQGSSPYEGVLPWATLAWQQVATNADFKPSVERMQRLAEKLPPRGRYATEAAVAAAPLLVVSGKTAEARKLIAGHRTDKGVEQLAASLRVVVDDGTFNLDARLPGRTLGDWQSPLETAVTLILAAHGRWDDAFEWAKATPDAVAKTETSIIWSELFASRAVPAEDAAGFERARKAAEGLSPEGKVRLLARLASVKLSQGDRAAAEGLLGEAQSLLASLNVPQAVKVTGAKPLIALKLPEAMPLWQAALAATEIAGVQTELTQTAAAWENVLLAIRFLHGIAPSMSSMQERQKQVEGEQNRLQNELKAEMGLKKQDEIRTAFYRYKEKLKDVEKATDARYFWQQSVLEAAARFGLLDQVWDELQVLDRKQNIGEREPLLTSAVPLVVADRYAALGNDKKREEIYKAVASTISSKDPQVVESYAEHQFLSGDLPGTVARLNDSMTDAGALQETTLRLACRLAGSGKITEAIAFCSGIKDSALREDGLWLAAALAARGGHASEFVKASSGLGTMDSASANSGLVAGLKAPSLLKLSEGK
jgi:hypothetical protein